MSDAVIVLGMHRSGTSAAMYALRQLGVSVGPTDSLMPPTTQNPGGYWEQWPIVKAHERLLNQWGLRWDSDGDLPPDWVPRKETREAQQALAQFVRETFGGQPLWGFKDPRTCRLLPLWQPIFTAQHITPHYLLMTRDPDAVVRSLQRVDAETGRPTGHTPSTYRALAQRYETEAREYSAGQDCLIVRQEDLRSTPTKLLKAIQAWLPRVTSERQVARP